MSVHRQIRALMSKNFRILLGRHTLGTFLIAFIVPIALTALFSFAKNLFVPPATYGVGDARPIRSLPEALALAAKDDRKTVVFINNGYSGGMIDEVIADLSNTVSGAGANAVNLTSEEPLATLCRSTLRGVSTCYAAVVFQSSSNEGPDGSWNYTIRIDGALNALRIRVDKTDNDAEVYLLPFKKAIDTAISNIDGSAEPLPDAVNSIPYTDMTIEERENEIIRLYQKTVINWMGVTLAASVIFITYHQTGFLSQEKESGMARLIDAMMPVKKRWHGMCMRMFASHMSFSLIYLPGWVIGALIIRQGVFRHSSFLTVIVNQILGGLAMSSFSVFASSFFRNAQLSGNTTIIVTALMAILAQSLTRPDTATVAVLSVLFPPCAYVYFIVVMARFEYETVTTNLINIPPTKMSSFELSGLAIWIFLIIQIIVYPILGAFIEQHLHGANSHGRRVIVDPAEIQKYNLNETPLRIEGFSKVYQPPRLSTITSCFRNRSGAVTALKDLSLSAGRGQIVALLGANGSGKSTTLDAISGMHKLTSGTITIDGTGGLGIAPQKNVLWDDLTVEQHITIFNRLKAPNQQASKAEIRELIKAIDLDKKRKARAGTLSGGQKRKLQLGMMLTGGSAVCCVDEVSSGIDPLSRRKIWDILLAERGKRTMILTTHFLDEADLLADYIAVLSKGTLRAEGTSARLKDTLGGGYRVHVTTHGHTDGVPDVAGVEKFTSFDMVSYIAPSSALAAQVIRALEAARFPDYRFSGPTIEDVFLKLAEEIRQESIGPEIMLEKASLSKHDSAKDTLSTNDNCGSEPDGRLMLTEGRQIGYGRQITVLARKRLTVLKTNWIPHAIALVLPIFAACLTYLFVRGQAPIGCTPSENNSNTGHESSFDAGDLGALLLIGPQSVLQTYDAQAYLNSSTTSFAQYNITPQYYLASTMDAFVEGIKTNYSIIAPGGFFIPTSSGTAISTTVTPVLAYMANKYMSNALIMQNTMNSLMAGVSISTQYQSFATPWNPSMGNSLQMVTYMCIALVAYPAFFALYPNVERRHLIRGFEYSNGVRPLPLWLAYTGLDFLVVLTVSAIITIVWAAASSIWYHIGYVFLVLMLYGLAATLFGYMFSLWAKTQLGTYAYVAVVQIVVFVGYLIGYMSTLSYAPITKVDHELLVVHYTISAVAPIGSVVRALLLVLNLFSASCDGNARSSDPSGIKYYGGPILYLIVQIVAYSLVILCVDGGVAGSWYRKMFAKRPAPVTEEQLSSAETKTPAATHSSGLVVQNLTKSFSRNTVVDNLSFDIRHGEVFALLGPNGAGKSTTISMIRGDLRPSGRFGGDALVESHSVTQDLVAARAHLGVCPQFDAIDHMTVREHLFFYARVRGVAEEAHSVDAILSAVGLRAFADRPAHALSGGNKRKLSLGIALMGNPGVVILDEPSSGLDAAAKRIMWRTLQNTVPGRSILLTTHSMEEADALAGRVGIMAKRMLAMGTIDELRARFGDALHIHIVSKTAPRTSADEMDRLVQWVQRTLPGAVIEDKTYHGQMRFAVPASAVFPANTQDSPKTSSIASGDTISHEMSRSAIGRLLVLIEENKDALGIEHYSVSTTTLDQVFLAIVGQNNVLEENYESKQKREWWKFGRRG